MVRVRRRAGTRTGHRPTASRPGRSAHPANRRGAGSTGGAQLCGLPARSTSACQARRAAVPRRRGSSHARGSCPTRASRVPPRPAAVRRCSRARRTGPGRAKRRPGPAGSRPTCCHRPTGDVPQPVRVVPPATEAPVDGRTATVSTPTPSGAEPTRCTSWPLALVQTSGPLSMAVGATSVVGSANGGELPGAASTCGPASCSPPRAAPEPGPAAQHQVQAGEPGLHHRRLVPLSQQDRSLLGQPRPGQLPADTDGSGAVGPVPHHPGLPHPHRGRRPAARRAAHAAP